MSELAVAERPGLKRTFHAIIPHTDRAKVRILLCLDSASETERWSLPGYEPEEGFFAVVSPLNKGLEAQLGITVVVLRCLKVVTDREVEKRVDAIFCMENRSPAWTPPPPMRWVNLEEFSQLRLVREDHRPTIESWFAESARGVVPPRRVPWALPGWYDAATEWIRAHLAEHGVTLLGPSEQVKQWGISSILRARTESGDYYLKAAFSLFAQEPLVTQALARMFPGQVPEPLAVLAEPEQGWMLMRDFGEDEGEPQAAQLDGLLRLYAQMQIGCIKHVDTLLEGGFVDRRLAVLATQIDDLLADPKCLKALGEEEVKRLRAAAPRLKSMCVELENCGVPQTLSHGDFHAGNTIMKDGKYLIFDWTDACITHPFLDLSVITGRNSSGSLTSEELDRLRDNYLQHWSAYAPVERLQEAARLALTLGALHQAVSYKKITDSLEDAAQWEFAGAAEAWLKVVLEAL